MSPIKNSSKQPVGEHSRNRVMSDQLKVEKFMSMVDRLPAVIMINSVWGMIFFFAAVHNGAKINSLIISMIVFMGMTGWIYKRLSRLPKPIKISYEKIIGLEVGVGFAGIFWGVCMLICLPQISSEINLLLAIGCLLMTTLVAEIMYMIPTANLVSMSSILFSSMHLSRSMWPDLQLVLGLLFGLMIVGTFWTMLDKKRRFATSARVLIERNRFLAISNAAVMTRDQFLENVSHEIKTPLTALLGYSSLLMASKSNMPPNQGELLDRLNMSASSLSETVEKILDVSKLRAGQLYLQEDSLDICIIIKGLVASVKKSADEKGVSIHFQSSTDIPKSMIGDAQRIRQIISNLISNALKFTNSGCIRVIARCERPTSFESDQDMLCVSVIDTGIGIKNSSKKSIFRGFYQVDGSVTRKYGGIGLSLANSRMLANLMSGELEFESDGLSGSTFKFWLPIKRENRLPSNFSDDKAQIDGPIVSRNILIVDDDGHIRHYLSTLFIGDGWSVDVCENGFLAVEKCSICKYSLILMDVQMPLMTGIDASRIIWAGERNKNTPIVILTGYLSVDRISELNHAGISNYFVKPMKSDRLLSKARKLVENHI